MSQKYIFTFFDEEFSPPYLKLCISTWKVNKQGNYKINIINHNNLSSFLPYNLTKQFFKINKNYFSNFVDIIALYILYDNGGVFLDADTVLTQKTDFFEVLLNQTDLAVFSEGNKKICPGCMIANKNSKILKTILNQYSNNKDKMFSFERNSLINSYVPEYAHDEILFLDSEAQGYQIERKIFGVYTNYLYQTYYFSNNYSTEEFFEKSKGITALRNSLTDNYFKSMNIKDFLSQDILLSKILKRICS